MVNAQFGPSLVVQLTVVVPTGKEDPDAGAQVTVPHEPTVVGEKIDRLVRRRAQARRIIPLSPQRVPPVERSSRSFEDQRLRAQWSNNSDYDIFQAIPAIDLPGRKSRQLAW